MLRPSLSTEVSVVKMVCFCVCLARKVKCGSTKGEAVAKKLTDSSLVSGLPYQDSS